MGRQRSEVTQPDGPVMRGDEVRAAAADGFEAFFRSEHARVIALGMAITGDVELAKEVAQEAFLRAYREWDRVAGYDRPAQWVRRVAVNLAMDSHRRRRSARRALERLRPSDVALLPDPVADDWWAVVRELPAIIAGDPPRPGISVSACLNLCLTSLRLD